MSTSSTKRRIGRFHVVVVQWASKNMLKSVMHVQRSYFAHKTNCFLTLLLSSSSSSSSLKFPNCSSKERIHSRKGLIGSFDVLCSDCYWIADPDPKEPTQKSRSSASDSSLSSSFSETTLPQSVSSTLSFPPTLSVNHDHITMYR